MDSIKIYVHPLVVMSISDHYTRALYRQPKGKTVKVSGFVIGQQSGKQLDVANLIELPTGNEGSDEWRSFAQKRVKAYADMYSDLRVIGWYQAYQGQGDEPNDADYKFTNEVISPFCEGQEPLMFIFNVHSQPAEDKKVLPIFCYEAQRSGFKLLDFGLASSEAEQIAVNDVVEAVDPDAK